MSSSVKKLRLRLIGGFRLDDQHGQPIEIASKKGRILLAMLAVADGGERSRSWLQEKLWSRGSAQDSLRRELASLRRLFNSTGFDPLPRSVPRDVVRLELNCFDIDIDSAPGGVFLDGLSIAKDEIIEAWLDEMRQFYIQSATPLHYEGSKNAPDALRLRESQILLPTQPGGAVPAVVNADAAENVARLGVAIHPIAWQISERLEHKLKAFVNDTAGRIGRMLLCSGGIDIIDLSINAMMPDMTRMPIHAGVRAELMISVDETISGVFLKLQLLESDTRRLLCSRRCEIEIGKAGEACTPEYTARKFIAESVDEILFTIVKMEQSRSEEVASVVRLIHEGVDGMFQLSDAGLDQARVRFDTAIDQMPDSITHAWRAYLCTQLIDDARITDVDALRSEARWHATKALEMDRFNPLTRSLLTHVYSFALHEFDMAAELIQMANELSSDHLMTYDADALLQLYMGKLDGSRESALQASNLGRLLPYRYLFLTSLCMIESLAGNFEQSIIAGEHALKLHPLGADRVYPPIVRYLSESYARSGDEEKAAALVESVKLDNKLSVEALAKRGRPSQDIDNFLRVSMNLVQ